MIAVKHSDAFVAVPPRENPRRRSKLVQHLGNLIQRIRRCSRASDAVEPLFWDRNAAFLLSLAALHQGEFMLAERELTNSNGPRAVTDARCLNLLGVVYESTGRWGLARQCYGRAIRADKRYRPPQLNLRRYYELTTFGRTQLPISLGDEKDVLS